MSCGDICIEPICNPCPKTCIRIARPYVGWLGIILYVVEIPVVIVFSLMMTNIIYTEDKLLLGLVLAVTILTLIFWVINLLWRAPCFSSVRAPYCGNPCGIELLAKQCPGDYARRVQDDAYHTSDETHFRNSLLTGIFVLFLYALIVRNDGRRVFDYLTEANFTAQQTTFFVIGRLIILAAIGGYGLSIRTLLDAWPDFIFRHVTAVPIDPTLGKESAFVPLQGKKAQSLGRKNAHDDFDVLSC